MQSADKITSTSTNAHLSSKKSTVPTIEDAISTLSSKYTGTQQRCYKPSQGNPTDEMVKRWLRKIQKEIPNIDLVDMSAEYTLLKSQKRQFAPQYAQISYNTMLQQEEAIGDYTAELSSPLNVSSNKRQQMVILIEHLHAVK